MRTHGNGWEPMEIKLAPARKLLNLIRKSWLLGLDLGETIPPLNLCWLARWFK